MKQMEVNVDMKTILVTGGPDLLVVISFITEEASDDRIVCLDALTYAESTDTEVAMQSPKPLVC